METSEIRVVLSTFPDLDKARQIGTSLVESQLASCVNLIPQIESIYTWKSEVQRDSEVLALIKTTDAGFDALAVKLAELHPYDVPEIVALPVSEGATPYLNWVRETIEPG